MTLSNDSQQTLKDLTPEFLYNVQKCIDSMIGSIIYIQKGHVGKVAHEYNEELHSHSQIGDSHSDDSEHHAMHHPHEEKAKFKFMQ